MRTGWADYLFAVEVPALILYVRYLGIISDTARDRCRTRRSPDLTSSVDFEVKVRLFSQRPSRPANSVCSMDTDTHCDDVARYYLITDRTAANVAVIIGLHSTESTYSWMFKLSSGHWSRWCEAAAFSIL